jgi:hypothetical protein
MGVSRVPAREVPIEGSVITPNNRELYGALRRTNLSGARGTRMPRVLQRQGDGVLNAFVERVVRMMAIRNSTESFLAKYGVGEHSDDGDPVLGYCTIYHGGAWVEIHVVTQGNCGEITGQVLAPWESPMRYDW